ncbi:hypothetical protein DW934_03400 [Blautia obeum]|uniref:Uncharacterized protein n=1 Tax=Blautia obeum TaxID=40520 RepID=A0A414JB99_9FIRM|nr:hypothetical protein [Blautia obeum]RHA50035.1 hypothetical protein DW934_03400 [Blautia obeum]RHE41825.1 hypothetical protein DW740_00455 [Blautia obeum]
MEVFTDGSEALEEPEQVFDNSESGDSSTSEPEITETEENEATTLSPSPDTQPEQNDETVDVVEDQPEETPDVSSVPSYEELLTAVTEQTTEIKAIRELEEKKQDYYTSYQNMSYTMIVGIGLLFGCVCALILSNYLRHG